MTLLGKCCFACIILIIGYAAPLFGLEEGLKIEKIVEDTIREKLVTDYPELVTSSIQIRITNSNIYRQLPIGAWTAELKVPEKAKVLGKTVQDLMVYDKAGEHLGKISVYISTDGNGIIYKAKDLIKKGTLIQKDNLEIVEESLIAQPVHRVRQLKNIIGKEAKFVIAKEAVITSYSIREVPAVRSGKVVTLHLKKPGLAFEFRGKVLSDGYVGDEISVKSLMGKKSLLKGEIIDSQNIRIVPSDY